MLRMNSEQLFKSAILKVHPDLNQNDPSATSKVKLLTMFRNNGGILRELINSWGLKIEENPHPQVKENNENRPFEFPYPIPNLEFRIGDYVMYEDKIYNIVAIKRTEDKWLFVLALQHEETNEIIESLSIFRDNLLASVDRNFYLYKSRGEKFPDEQIEY